LRLFVGQGEENMNLKNMIAAGLLLGTLSLGIGLAKEKTLYDNLGKKKGITGVVNDFVGNVGGDARINGYFKATVADPKRLAKFKKNLIDQICQAAGGPCVYTGKDMKTAHAGMGVDDAAFGALVEDLVKSLDKFHVAEKDKNTLLGVLGPMKKDIVEK
jgi:hemoglobin